jgi:hypothetical protein
MSEARELELIIVNVRHASFRLLGEFARPQSNSCPPIVCCTPLPPRVCVCVHCPSVLSQSCGRFDLYEKRSFRIRIWLRMAHLRPTLTSQYTTPMFVAPWQAVRQQAGSPPLEVGVKHRFTERTHRDREIGAWFRLSQRVGLRFLNDDCMHASELPLRQPYDDAFVCLCLSRKPRT